MRSDVKLLLLKLVKHNGNISSLIKSGYHYSQIIDFLGQLIEEGKLEKTESGIVITDPGDLEIEILNKKLQRKDSSVWIEPDIGHKISSIDKNEVFLPSKDEISF